MSRLPSLFISHGAPTFALEPGLAGPRLTALGRQLPQPQAVLVVSPHWMTPTPCVSTSAQPETIHDVGSGSLTHNLYEFRGTHGPDEPYVRAFSGWVREAVEQGDRTRLLRTLDDAPDARRAHPTTEHFWPLLVAAGAADTGEGLPSAQVIEGGIAYGMLAMDSYAFGLAGSMH